MSSTGSPMYIIKKSRVPIDLIQFPDYDPAYDAGLGLYQNFDGNKKIKFLCPKGTITTVPVHVHKFTMGDPQHMYDIDSAMYDRTLIVPTKKSIVEGNIHFAFRIQHSSDNPTHRLMWVFDTKGRDYPHSYPQLVPVPNRELKRVMKLHSNIINEFYNLLCLYK